ncbi:MAG: hypothetical protein A3B96_04415 [Candidatus Spechtbacteria bacterium RIFCSPHIGHO2_02_FULL_43_15b]|nr:MAG: hypothetical protein A3B96_04415 [Candidatus Spechtbacteria bacterium RIFCSPHIGHO2_02_FULL_43_15b]
MIKYDYVIPYMKRSKITITIRKDLLKQVDQIVDTEQIRNRSHAIEYLLAKSLVPKVHTALILAGGRGVKMKPLTRELPKPLLSIHGKPILEYQIELLRESDIRNIVILIGHLGEKIKYHFGDGSKFGVRINYIEQGARGIGTGYGLYLSRSFMPADTFIMMYGDELLQIDMKDFSQFHIGLNTVATIALSSTRDSSLYGVAKLRGEKVVEFLEKPKEKDGLSRLISAGVFCLNAKIFGYLSAKRNLSLESDVFPGLARDGELGGYSFESKWFDVSTPETYAKAISQWKK